MSRAGSKATLNPIYLTIALLPALVLLISMTVLRDYGDPINLLPERFAEFDVHKEGAARMSALAALMLFGGASFGALIFFLYTLLMLDRTGRWMMVAAFLLLSAAAVLVQTESSGRSGEDYVGFDFGCLSAGYTKAQSDHARAVEFVEVAAARTQLNAVRQAAGGKGAAPGGQQAKEAAQPPAQLEGVAVKHLPQPQPCTNSRFEQVRTLSFLQVILMTLGFSALVFGAICCLADPPASTDKPAVATSSAPKASPPPAAAAESGRAPDTLVQDEEIVEPVRDWELQYWEQQSVWLNTYLYLAALLLGTGLLFLNAMLSWPAFSLMPGNSYSAYVASLVSYYGFVFTIMLIAFYVPVAIRLGGKLRQRAKQLGSAPKVPDAFKGPRQILKILLGLFSTALAGLLPSLLEISA